MKYADAPEIQSALKSEIGAPGSYRLHESRTENVASGIMQGAFIVSFAAGRLRLHPVLRNLLTTSALMSGLVSIGANIGNAVNQLVTDKNTLSHAEAVTLSCVRTDAAQAAL